MYIQVTNVDSESKVVCTKEPMRMGASLPDLKGFQFIFAEESKYPIELDEVGCYITAPLYYGICDEDAETRVSGVIKVMSKVEFEAAKEEEHQARKPYPSWVGDISTMSWQPPVPYPQDDNRYYWDEPTTSWKQQTPVVALP